MLKSFSAVRLIRPRFLAFSISLVLASRSSLRFFESAEKTLEVLLPAIFMGDEARVAKMVGPNPGILFERGPYKMPLLNEDSTLSRKSEQIYPNISPLELSLFTGDWKLWDRIFLLIPESMIEAVFHLMNQVKRGGSDLVKMKLLLNALKKRPLMSQHQRTSIVMIPCL